MPKEMERTYLDKKGSLLDVRKQTEFESEHLKDSKNIPLNVLESQLATLSKETPYIIYCAGGYRSMIAASIFMRKGYSKIVDVVGGYSAIAKETDLPKTDYSCPTSKL